MSLGEFPYGFITISFNRVYFYSSVIAVSLLLLISVDYRSQCGTVKKGQPALGSSLHSCCVALGSLLHLSGPHFPLLNTGVEEPGSQGRRGRDEVVRRRRARRRGSSHPATAFVLSGQDRDSWSGQVSSAALAPKSLTTAHLSGAVSQSVQ